MPPSPNLRTLNQVLLYPGVAWVEGANLSVGRGTGHPFEWVGAPWVDATRWAEALNAAALPGLRFAAIEFTPETGRYRGVPCHGVRIEVTDRDQVDAPLLGAHLVASLLRLSPGEFEMDRTMGIIGSADTFEALQAGIDPGTVAGRWEDALARFRERRQRYLIY